MLGAPDLEENEQFGAEGWVCAWDRGDFMSAEGRFLRKTLCCVLMSARFRQHARGEKHPVILK